LERKEARERKAKEWRTKGKRHPHIIIKEEQDHNENQKRRRRLKNRAVSESTG
jgi:hypothetical protein